MPRKTLKLPVGQAAMPRSPTRKPLRGGPPGVARPAQGGTSPRRPAPDAAAQGGGATPTQRARTTPKRGPGGPAPATGERRGPPRPPRGDGRGAGPAKRESARPGATPTAGRGPRPERAPDAPPRRGPRPEPAPDASPGRGPRPGRGTEDETRRSPRPPRRPDADPGRSPRPPRAPEAESRRAAAMRAARPKSAGVSTKRRFYEGAPEAPAPRRGRDDAPEAALPRLSRLMSERGLCSRREADEWIEAGWVRVDGRITATLGSRVAPEAVIEIDPRARGQQAERVTILLHKPLGFVSGQPEDGHPAAVTLVGAASRWAEDRLPRTFRPAQLRGLAPAGRLDIDSTGLLVFTQDGRIARALIGEDSAIEKEYLVRVEGGLPPHGLALLNHGLALDGVALKPAKVSWANEDQLRFVLREGRKRQIRRMCELVGLKVTGLKRIRIGSVKLGPLPAGAWRYLRPDEKF